MNRWVNPAAGIRLMGRVCGDCYERETIRGYDGRGHDHSLSKPVAGAMPAPALREPARAYEDQPNLGQLFRVKRA